mmetsp:Transcript_1412/g.2164  ORF Transcript_1412/g.2164 Transcript_1412/m.2164 type:complete len:81 (+) Transcript_1412:370-612(+)
MHRYNKVSQDVIDIEYLVDEETNHNGNLEINTSMEQEHTHPCEYQCISSIPLYVLVRIALGAAVALYFVFAYPALRYEQE